MSVATAWVKPPHGITGQDHLGVRAPCEGIYKQLLPGITNVTDRARYYSLYPWLLWAFGQHDGKLKRKPFFHTLRRADCLFTLIAGWHDSSGEKNPRIHDSLIGSKTLFPVAADLEEGESLRLSTYATTNQTGQRYFKNLHGGLGQYYLGSLREVGLMLGGSHGEEITYTTERGLVLAQAFDSGVDRGRFFDALEADEVTADTLEELQPFCACRLAGNEPERGALADLFFNRQGVFYDGHGGERRRNSLALLLNLAMNVEQSGYLLDAGLLRACAYGGALPGGDEWALPPSLEGYRLGWQLYQRSELLAMAAQGMFWAGLSELLEQGRELENSEAYGRWFVDTFSDRLSSRVDESFAAAVARTKAELPPLGLWEDDRHEIQSGWRISDMTSGRGAAGRRAEVLDLSLNLMLTLAARDTADDLRGATFAPPPQTYAEHPINLLQFRRHAGETWKNMSVGEMLGWLAAQWGVERHLRVALGKLRYRSEDTFRIKPVEGRLVVKEVPQPGFTGPRLRQALQILHDLNALDTDAVTGTTSLTTLGYELLEECGV
jgi:hypothetical protein